MTLLAAGHAFGVEFKGVELGQPLWLSEERAVFGQLDCNPMQMSPDEYREFVEELKVTMPDVRKVCAGSTSIATVPADVTVLLGPSRRVLKLTFQFAGADYSRVVEAMTAKWGTGIAEVRDVNDESVWWDFDDGAMVSVHVTPGAADATDAVPIVALAEYSVAVLTPTTDL